MKIGSFVKITKRCYSTCYSYDKVVRETKEYWVVGEREIKFNKNTLKSIVSTKWDFESIEEISEELYSAAINKIQIKEQRASIKSSIMETISNPSFLNISDDKLLKLKEFLDTL